MGLLDRLVNDLRTRAAIAVETNIVDLETLIMSAHQTLFATTPFDQMTDRMAEFVTKKAHCLWLYRQASSNATSFRFKTVDFEGDPSTITRNLLAVAKSLEDTINEELEATGMGDKFTVHVGNLVRKDPFNGYVGYNAQSVPPVAPELTVAAIGTDLHFEWTTSAEHDFSTYHLYVWDSPNMVRNSNAGPLGTKLHPDCRKLATIIRRSQNGFTAETRPYTSPFYAVVVTERGTGNYAYSDEVLVEAP